MMLMMFVMISMVLVVIVMNNYAGSSCVDMDGVDYDG